VLFATLLFRWRADLVEHRRSSGAYSPHTRSPRSGGPHVKRLALNHHAQGCHVLGAACHPDAHCALSAGCFLRTRCHPRTRRRLRARTLAGFSFLRTAARVLPIEIPFTADIWWPFSPDGRGSKASPVRVASPRAPLAEPGSGEGPHPGFRSGTRGPRGGREPLLSATWLAP